MDHASDLVDREYLKSKQLIKEECVRKINKIKAKYEDKLECLRWSEGIHITKRISRKEVTCHPKVFFFTVHLIYLILTEYLNIFYHFNVTKEFRKKTTTM